MSNRRTMLDIRLTDEIEYCHENSDYWFKRFTHRFGKYLSENDKHFTYGITMIISGGARGIDTLAEEYADARGIPKMIFLPDYNKHGRVAPLIRKIAIVDNADIVIAFWDGKSGGTNFTIEYAKSKHKKLIVYSCSRLE